MRGLIDKLSALQVQFLDLLSGMTQRDRFLFVGLIAAVLVGFVGLSLFTMSNRLSSMESRISDREDSLQQIRLLIADYEAAQEQAQAIQAELSNHSSTDLSAFLDKSAEEVQIGDKLDSVKEKSEADDGVLVEKMYAVALSNLTEVELANFLYQIETDGYPLQIKALRIKRRTRGEEMSLRVDMDIAAYQLSEGDLE